MPLGGQETHTGGPGNMAPVKCPFCRKPRANMRQHLRVSHGILNLRERHLWVSFSLRKVTEPFRPCPLCGRSVKYIRPHFANSHKDLSDKELKRTVRHFQWEITMERLRELEASNPEVPLVTLDEPSDDPDTQNEVCPPVCPPVIPASSDPHTGFSFDAFLMTIGDGVEASVGVNEVEPFEMDIVSMSFMEMLEDNSMDPLQWGDTLLGPQYPSLEDI
nr:uncharacterized protein LOC129446116 [Misgurnus anguillicaudatus]